MAGNNNKNVREYDSIRVKTSSLKGLICFMHSRMLSLIKSGIEEGSRRDIERAQNLVFLLELAVTKNEDASKVLADLYAYSYYLLEKADAHSMVIARKILETLSGTFDALARQKVV